LFKLKGAEFQKPKEKVERVGGVIQIDSKKRRRVKKRLGGMDYPSKAGKVRKGY